MEASKIWTDDCGLSFDEAQAVRRWWFDKIANTTDWKCFIGCWIDRKDFENCNEAAIFFTGGPITIEKELPSDKERIYVTGDGYYENIGA